MENTNPVQFVDRLVKNMEGYNVNENRSRKSET
jgi:hypothetical protein